MVFEYVEKNLLEVLEENTVGIDVSIRRVTTELHADRKLEPETMSSFPKCRTIFCYVIT